MIYVFPKNLWIYSFFARLELSKNFKLIYHKNIIMSKHRIKYQTEKMKVPVIFHASEELLPDKKTYRQLEYLAQD